jgi:hypothetical protein
MNNEELRKQFFVDDDVLKVRLETLVSKASKYCKIDKLGQVMILDANISRKNQVMLTLIGRAIASQLDSKISANVNISEIAKSTDLAENQIRARLNEFMNDRYRLVDSPSRGIYRAVPHKIETFLDALSPQPPEK